MIIRHFTLFLIFLLPSLQAFAQEYALTGIPVQLLIGADAVIREEVQHVEVKNNKQATVTYRMAVTLLKESSLFDELAVFYNDDVKLGKVRAWLYDARGNEIRKIQKDDLLDRPAVDGFSVFQDMRYKYFTARHSQYPYTLVYEYDKEISGIRFASFPNWSLDYFKVAVQKASFIVGAPKDFELHHTTVNLELEPEITVEGGNTRYQWDVTNLPAITTEERGPGPDELLPMILAGPDAFEVEGYKGSLASWVTYGTFMQELFEGRDQLPDDVKAEVKKLTANLATPSEKIEVLYRYLQKNMRYVSVQLGLGGWQPFDAEYVAERKYGDCKALSNYMMALLREAGIESNPVLIHSGASRQKVIHDFANPGVFNHVVLYVPEEDIWLECTSSTTPVNYLGESNSDRDVLMISNQGGKILHTPALDYSQNVETFLATIVISEDGGANVQQQIESTGGDHESYRSMASFASREDQEKWLRNSTSLPSLTLNSLDISAAPNEPRSNLTFNVDARRFGTKVGKRMFVPLNGVHPFTYKPDVDDDRKQAVYWRRGYTELDSITMEFPEGYRVEALPESPVLLETEFGTYEMELKPGPERLEIIRRLEVREGKWPAEKFGDFRAFFLEVSTYEAQKLVLVQDKT